MSKTKNQDENMSSTLYVEAGAQGGDGSEGSPFGSIQDAIDAADAGTVIQVGAGTYTENLVFREGGSQGNPVTLVTSGGPGSVTINPADASKDTIRISGADNIVIDGFTLTGSDDPSRQVIHVHAKSGNTDPASNIIIRNNIIDRGEGDGIKVSKSAGISIIDNKISGGGDKESAIDFVGVVDASVVGNEISDINGIALMVKGGSSNIDITDNLISNIGGNAVEIGGYTPEKFYLPGFLDDGNSYEAKDVTFSGNTIYDVGKTAIRIIGAQSVDIYDNVVTAAAKVITIDDSSKFHPAWFADALTFWGNDFAIENWLIDRSDHANVTLEEPPSEPDLSPFDTGGDTFTFVDPPIEVTSVPDPIVEEMVAGKLICGPVVDESLWLHWEDRLVDMLDNGASGNGDAQQPDLIA